MYYSQFGLTRRPFSSTPDPSCVVPVGGMPEAISELEHCALDGQGIGILTAPAGLGKTVLCRKLAENLRDRFAVVFLPNANFPTRRSLLQAVLYEMGHPYLRLGEQELRLEFSAAVRDLCPDREGLVIIIDEAHLLHNRLLEELRTATHLVHNGEMLVRLILSGQLELEERLIKKELAAINQRIVCHPTLASLTMLESQEYLEQRLEWAGGALSKIFQPEAVRMVCQASDGNPRCLNQLADHSLLVASACNDSRITPAHVLEALEELKQLPLQWNHIATPRAGEGLGCEPIQIPVRPAADSEMDDDEPQTACFEWGPPEENVDNDETTTAEAEAAWTEEEISEEPEWVEAVWTEPEDTEEMEIFWETMPEDEPDTAVETPASESSAESGESAAEAGEDLWSAIENFQFEEEHVEDHYALLDRGILPPPVVRESRDWWIWDPVEELRAEEDAFDVPPAVPSEPPVIERLPLPGEEWQPEDLPTRKAIGPDPSELIEKMLPLIDAALVASGREGQADELIAHASLETILANISEIVDAGTSVDLESLPFVIDSVPVWEGDPASGKSHDVFMKVPAEEPSADLEEQIAQLVLDTHTDLQPLLWSSTTESEPQSPPSRIEGEEPIRDPGDPTPFEQLRESLQKAVEAVQPIAQAEEISPRPMPIEYDIVMPEPDEEPTDSRPITRTDAPNGIENHATRRPYENLFSKIRHKKQA